MKLTTKILAGATALAFLTLAGSLQAQALVTNLVTISFMATLKDTSTNDNGTVTTTPAPKKRAVTTSTILGWLAIDKEAYGNGYTGFPAGVKLVVVSDSENGWDFQVLDKHNNFLVDVSGLLSVTDSGPYGADITSGKTYDATGGQVAAPSTTDQSVKTITYDDSESFGMFQFSFAGVFTSTTTDTKPDVTTGNYKQTEKDTLGSGQGYGQYMGDPFVITEGSLSASGSGELSTQ